MKIIMVDKDDIPMLVPNGYESRLLKALVGPMGNFEKEGDVHDFTAGLRLLTKLEAAKHYISLLHHMLEEMQEGKDGDEPAS